MENWKINVVENFTSELLDVYVFRAIDGNMKELLQDGGETIITVKEGEVTPKPSMKMTREMASAFIDKFDKMGIKPESRSFTEGKLLATENHLEDMRTLLKVNK